MERRSTQSDRPPGRCCAGELSAAPSHGARVRRTPSMCAHGSAPSLTQASSTRSLIPKSPASNAPAGCAAMDRDDSTARHVSSPSAYPHGLSSSATSGSVREWSGANEHIIFDNAQGSELGRVEHRHRAGRRRGARRPPGPPARDQDAAHPRRRAPSTSCARLSPTMRLRDRPPRRAPLRRSGCAK